MADCMNTIFSVFRSIFAAVLVLGNLAIAVESTQAMQSPVHAAGKEAPGDSLHNSATPPPLRVVKNNAFTTGEILEYAIRLGPINAGNARFSVPEMVDYHGHSAYRIVSETWSNRFFSRFYKIHDWIESITDARGLFTWQKKKRLREGKYKADVFFTYDQKNHLAISQQDTLAVPPFVQDVLSAIYYIRTRDFAPGDTILVDHHSEKKVYPLKLIVHKRERVKVKAGKFNCLVVEPVLRTAGVFKHRGRIKAHLTDDHRKIPVLMSSRIYAKGVHLGNIVAELQKMEGVLDR